MSENQAGEWTRRLVITTPEQVELRFETAGIGSRVGAQLIDMLILLLIYMALALAGWLAIESIPGVISLWLQEYAAAILILIFAALSGGYFLIGEYVTGGRTIGKRAMGIRVIQDNGRPISFLSSTIRNLLRVIDSLPLLYFVGALFSFFHPHDKRLGDIAAGTAVVYEMEGRRRQTKRMEKQLAAWASSMPNLGLEPWVREQVSEEEWSLVSGFAERLPYLAPRRAEQLAMGIVELLGPKLGLAERWNEAVEAAQHPPEPAADGSVQRRPVPNAGKRRSMAVAWTLALYTALRADWDLYAEGGKS